MSSAPVRSMYHERPDYRVDLLARTNVMTAWLGDACLARSNACLTVDEQDHGLVVYFPPDAVDFSRLAAGELASRGAIRNLSPRSPGWPATSHSTRTRSA